MSESDEGKRYHGTSGIEKNVLSIFKDFLGRIFVVVLAFS